MPSCLLAAQVEVFCYALSASDNSEWRTRIQAEVEHFVDVSSWAVQDIARKISADGIQARPCPVQATSHASCSQAVGQAGALGRAKVEHLGATAG